MQRLIHLCEIGVRVSTPIFCLFKKLIYVMRQYVLGTLRRKS